VNWTIKDTNNASVTTNLGSISAQGVYTASLIPPAGQSVTITATSQAVASETMSVPVTIVFGDKVLSGSYVFSASGRLVSSNSYWARAGYFTAGGGALSGIEDTNQGGAPNIVDNNTNIAATPIPRSFTGSYAIDSDGRGTIQFCEDTNSPCPMGGPASSSFRIAVVSPSQVEIIEFSPSGSTSAMLTAGGEILSQNPLVSPNIANLSGTYSFNFTGISTGATEESVLGEFLSDGFGNVSAGSSNSPGEMDINPTASSVATTLPASAYSISSNGRGTIVLNGLNFSFYPVSANRVKFIEIDNASSGTPTTPASILVGDAYKQQTPSTCGWGLSSLNGSIVYETSGLDSRGGSPGVLIGDLGDFSASNGTISLAELDENSGGSVPAAQSGLSGSYAVGVPCGRGTLSIGARTYVFYLISTSNAVFQETTAGIIAHGLISQSQGGPFANSTLTGSYAFRLDGTDAAGTAGNREDFLGQITSTGSGAGLAGNFDLNDFGATQTGCVPLTTGCVAITNGTYLPAGNLRATMSLPLTTAPTTSTRNLVLYMVSPTLFYALGVDPTGSSIGAIYNQF
jgi:hypothetical protein